LVTHQIIRPLHQSTKQHHDPMHQLTALSLGYQQMSW
jgi:hypothetical protein